MILISIISKGYDHVVVDEEAISEYVRGNKKSQSKIPACGILSQSANFFFDINLASRQIQIQSILLICKIETITLSSSDIAIINSESNSS